MLLQCVSIVETIALQPYDDNIHITSPINIIKYQIYILNENLIAKTYFFKICVR